MFDLDTGGGGDERLEDGQERHGARQARRLEVDGQTKFFDWIRPQKVSLSDLETEGEQRQGARQARWMAIGLPERRAENKDQKTKRGKQGPGLEWGSNLGGERGERKKGNDKASRRSGYIPMEWLRGA